MLPYAWRLALGVSRTALSVGSLVLFVAAPDPVPVLPVLPIAAYLLYSLYAIRRAMAGDRTPVLTLGIDTAAFLAWFLLTAWSGFGGAGWLVLNAAMFLYLLASSILNQEWTKAAAVLAVCLAAVYAAPPSAQNLRAVMWSGASLGALWMLHRRYLEIRLSQAARHSVMYRFEAQQAREDERQRIAADFHDGPLQSFIGFQMRLEIVKKLLERDPAVAADELRQLQELCRSQVAELRAFVRSMRPADVEGASLGASVSRMVEQFQKDSGISASFLSGEHLDPSETEVSLEILQIVREALNNVQKHSRATRVAVSLNRKGEFLEISVDDNGGGFPFAGSYSLEELDLLRLGPLSIRRRVRALGGDLQVESKPGQGAGLKVRVAVE
jgi:signal transduction histidine kinase